MYDDCVLARCLSPDGYGVVSHYYKGKYITMRAHRLVYLMHVGPIGFGNMIHHKCGNRACINHEHLQLVEDQKVHAQADGNIGSVNRSKTHCPHGHPYSGDNLLINKTSGGRICRECQRRHGKEYYARKRGRKG